MATNNALNTGIQLPTAALTNGQLIIGSTGGGAVAGTITAGSGISVVNGPGTITVSSSPITWNVISTTSSAMVAFNGYISNNAGLVTLTLPATAAVGSQFNVVGLGAGGWKIAQNASQLIHLGNTTTTTGTGGSLASTNAFDSIELVCVVADTTFVQVNAPQGNITVV